MPFKSINDIPTDASFSEELIFDEERMNRFIEFSRDTAGIHTKSKFSSKKGFQGLVVHGFLLSVNFSRILGMELPGENTVIGTVNLEFHEPVYLGDKVKYTVSVDRLLIPLNAVVLKLDVHKSDGTMCVQGKSTCFFKEDKEK